MEARGQPSRLSPPPRPPPRPTAAVAHDGRYLPTQNAWPTNPSGVLVTGMPWVGQVSAYTLLRLLPLFPPVQSIIIVGSKIPGCLEDIICTRLGNRKWKSGRKAGSG